VRTGGYLATVGLLLWLTALFARPTLGYSAVVGFERSSHSREVRAYAEEGVTVWVKHLLAGVHIAGTSSRDVDQVGIFIGTEVLIQRLSKI
jgi:hypothetical protein